MKITKRTMTYLAGGVLLASAVTACHHGMHYGTAEERGEWVVQKVSSELELNDTQQGRLAEVKDQFLDARRLMKANREQHRAEVLAMLSQPTFDRDKANAMVGQQIETVNTRAPVVIDAIGNFWESLDADQRAELRKFIEDKMEHYQSARRWH